MSIKLLSAMVDIMASGKRLNEKPNMMLTFREGKEKDT